MLTNKYAARQATEPIFALGDDTLFQNFKMVFRNSLDDPGLLNAIMMTLKFALNGNTIDTDCLNYQTLALESIRAKCSAPLTDLVTSTLGAILLLVGLEIRLGQRAGVEMHMLAVSTLLAKAKEASVHLPDGIKRAIFW